MRKILWLLLLAIPPWIATELDAERWLAALCAVPFLLYAMTLGDPDETLLGDASPAVRTGALAVVGIGGAVLCVVGYVLWKVFFPSPA